MSLKRNNKKRLLAAARGADPDKKVYNLACQLKDDGMPQEELYKLYVEVQQQLEQNDDDQAYDAVLDTLDCIWGGPWAAGRDLFDDQLTEERLLDV